MNKISKQFSRIATLLLIIILGSCSNSTRNNKDHAKKIVVIGSGAAGIGFVTECMRHKAPYTLAWITADKDIPYKRTKLASVIADKTSPENTYLVTDLPDDIKLLRDTQVTSIDAQQQKVFLNNGTSCEYDYLFLAPGTSPRHLPVSPTLKGIFDVYSLHDAQAIKKHIENLALKKAVIIGCGINGLEVADALYKRGFEIHLIDRNEHMLQTLFDDHQASTFLENRIQNLPNVFYHPSQIIDSFLEKDGQVSGVKLSDGTNITTNLVISTIGVTPNLDLGRTAGLVLKNDAIVVDDFMKTSNDHIYAGGDCILVFDQGTRQYVRSSKWGDALKQGKLAALAIFNTPQPYPGAFIGYKTSFFGNEFFMSGTTKDLPSTHQRIQTSAPDFYHVFVVDKETTLKGFHLINKLTKARRLRRILQNQLPFIHKDFLS